MDSLTPVVIPHLGETVEAVRIVRWYKQVGDSIIVDEGLVEVTTDKTDILVDSPVSGTLVSIAFAVGDRVSVGTAIAVVRSA